MTKGESQRGRCVEMKVSLNNASMAANWAVDGNTKQKSNAKFQLQYRHGDQQSTANTERDQLNHRRRKHAKTGRDRGKGT